MMKDFLEEKPKRDREKKPEKRPEKKREKGPRKPLTPARLTRIALHYLERYAASEASLRRVLENRLRRAFFDDPSFSQDETRVQPLRQAIENIVESHKKTGVINDANFAAMKVHSLRRGGASANRIKEKLRSKGIQGTLVAQALEDHAQDSRAVFAFEPDGGLNSGSDGETRGEAEKKAALVFAKKRGLGPYRRAEKRAQTPQDLRAQRQKDAQTLARAGFGFDTIRAVLDQDFLDEGSFFEEF